MEAKELMIGNYVLVDGELIIVESINEVGINLFVDDEKIIEWADFGEETHHIKPIPLKAEWFNKRVKNWQSKFQISYSFEHGHKVGIFITLNGEHIKQIKYVHEAQNWHYMTTGKHLIINPS